MEKQNQPDAKTIRIIAIIAIVLGVLGIVKYIWAEYHPTNPLDKETKINTPTIFYAWLWRQCEFITLL
ncbi:hypothetical protein [Staphylococcus simulans]|nr:hypothetical protein [Staphylococcus simulans]